MSFRRIPFQFTSTDPAERQRELEKRFGAPLPNKMYVDAANPLKMGSGFNTSTSSPRFQHRVPMFVDGMPAQSSVDSSTRESKTPKVRIIPIEIEQDENVSSSRHRTFSGPADISKKLQRDSCSQKEDASTLKRSMEDLSKPSKMKVASGPRVHNIPIRVEQSEARDKKDKSEKGKMPATKSHPTVNGCGVSKQAKNDPESPPKESKQSEEERKKIDSLKKIDSVQEELKSYETGVNDFKGTAEDKQYRYLDEMLTRCMLKLDDIETMGDEEIKSARKKVVKMVQACIDLLESKVYIANNPDTSVDTNNEASLETLEEQDNGELSTDLEKEKSEVKENSNIVDIPEEKQPAGTEESKLPQSESSILDAQSSKCKSSVPEVEMLEVTSTCSDVNEKTGTVDSVTDQLKSNTRSTVSEEIPAVPSESNEVEMTEPKTDINNSQEQKEMPKPEVSSTNNLNSEKVSIDPTPIVDSNEAEMADVSSMIDNSPGIQKVEVTPEVSSSDIKLLPVEAISEQCKITKTVKPDETHYNCSSSDTNLQSSIPEVEMDIESSCDTNNTNVVDEQSNLQTECISNNELN